MPERGSTESLYRRSDVPGTLTELVGGGGVLALTEGQLTRTEPMQACLSCMCIYVYVHEHQQVTWMYWNMKALTVENILTFDPTLNHVLKEFWDGNSVIVLFSEKKNN